MKLRKKKSVFLKWLLTYLFMLGLMILASFAIYFYSFHVINGQQERVNEIMLEKIQTEVDDYFQSAKKTVISLLMDSKVETITRQKTEFSLSDRTLIYEVYEIIRNKVVSDSNYETIFIYFLHGDTVLSDEGHVDKELFYNLYYESPDLSEEDFRKLLEEKWTGNVVTIKNSAGQEELLFLWNSYPRGDSELDATIGISISTKDVISWMEELKWKENTEIMLINGENILCSNGKLGNILLEEYAIEDFISGEKKEVTLLGELYYIIFKSSPDNEFYYVAITPQAEIREEAKNIQVFMIKIMLGCLTLGLVAAYFLTKINYNPLKQVMDTFGAFDEATTESNEYEWLMDQKKRFYDEHKEAERKLSEKEMILRQQYLYRLVSLPYDNKSQKNIELAKEKLFEKPNVLVALFYIENLNLESSYARMDRSLGRFVFTNIIEELLEGRVVVELVDLTDSFACIINSDKEIGELREIFEDVLDKMQQFMVEHMELQLSVVFGSYQQGIDGVYPSYILAREAAEYRTSMIDTQVIWYEDIKNKQTLYQYSLETEQKIINAICIGQAKDVCTWIDEIIDLNYHKREITQMMKRCLISDIIGSIIKGAEQGGRTEFIISYMDENTMPEHWKEDKIREYLHNLVEGLCADIHDKEMQKREDNQFGWQVMEYVQQNYQNPDLNISIAALHFGITPSYLSSLFKEKTGLNLLEYINHTRVEHAKKLLEEGYSLNEICEKTGFRSSGALIRVFKKNTGITPGQMKKMLGQTNKE